MTTSSLEFFLKVKVNKILIWSQEFFFLFTSSLDKNDRKHNLKDEVFIHFKPGKWKLAEMKHLI